VQHEAGETCVSATRGESVCRNAEQMLRRLSVLATCQLYSDECRHIGEVWGPAAHVLLHAVCIVAAGRLLILVSGGLITIVCIVRVVRIF